MRNVPTPTSDRNPAMNWLAPALVTTGLFVASVTTAHPCQTVLFATAKPTEETTSPTRPVVTSQTKSPVLVRNTTAKVEPGPVTTIATVKKEDKKAIGRCWQRLMTMMREVSHAHRTAKTKQ